MPLYVTEYPLFFTASIKGRYKLLANDIYKDIVIDSFRFLVKDKRIKLNAFVIMPDHIHLIWQMQPLIHPSNVQRDCLKYTAQQMKYKLQKDKPGALHYFETDARDRDYNFWKRRPMSIELRNDRVYQQKLNYIHFNPVKAGLSKLPEEYIYSSAFFYQTGIDNWGFLCHYNE